jgi:hypothetical protein
MNKMHHAGGSRFCGVIAGYSDILVLYLDGNFVANATKWSNLEKTSTRSGMVLAFTGNLKSRHSGYCALNELIVGDTVIANPKASK